MGLFGNQSAQSGPPVGAVQQLRSQSRSDHEIIDTLSKQGYSSIDIYNALNQADQTQGGQDPSQQPITEAQPSQPYPQEPEPQPSQDQWSDQGASQGPPQGSSNDDPWGDSNPAQSSSQPSFQQPSQQPQEPSSGAWPSQPSSPEPTQPQNDPYAPPVHQQPAPQRQPQAPSFEQQPRERPQQPVFTGPSVSAGSDSIDSLDQIAEAIIDEKWKQLKTYIEKIVDWKGKVEARIIAIEQNQKRLDEQIIGLQKSLVDKVQTYDRHITDVGTEIKAMEKVFQKIIPSLTENVNELSNVVHRMKDDR